MCAAWLGASACLLLAAGSTSAAEPSWDPVLAEMGKQHFLQYCGSCHGDDGRGAGPVSGALRKPPADLSVIASRRDGRFPDGEIARFIDGRFDLSAHGTREMPVWGQRFSAGLPEPGLGDAMARGTIVTLIEFLKSIQRN